jgi:SAM-dependent methyltransferase
MGRDKKRSEHLEQEEQYHDDTAGKRFEGARKAYEWQIPEDRYLFGKVKGTIKGKSLLDLGCGTGASVKNLLDPAKYKYDYLGIDISSKLLKYAKKEIKKGRFLKANAEELPLEDGSVDVIVVLGLYHHLPDYKKSLKESFRVLKKGGLLLIREPTRRGLPKGKGDSPHEKGIKVDKFLKLSRKYCDVVQIRYTECRPIVLTGFFRNKFHSIFRLDTNSKFKPFWLLRFYIDKILINTLGRFIPYFQGLNFYLILKRK